jgi:hypothetical protein
MAVAIDRLPVPTPSEQPLAFNPLFEAIRADEQRLHFVATNRAPRTSGIPLEHLSDVARSIKPEQLDRASQDRHNRLFDRLSALAPERSEDGVVVNSTGSDKQALYDECRSRGLGLSLASMRLIESFLFCERAIRSLNDQNQFTKEQDRLIQELNTLESLLADRSHAGAEGLYDLNHAILLSLRSLCSSPLYNALRCTTGHPLTDLVHSLVLHQYTDTRLEETFEQFGRGLGAGQMPLPQRVQNAWDRFSRGGIGPSVLAGLFRYTFTQMVGIIISAIAYNIAQLFSLRVLAQWAGDERSICGNTPGVILEEKDSARTVRTIALAAPTLAIGASPEFRAALQALENNQYTGSQTEFFSWNYTNLQSFSPGVEHQSSLTLCSLADEFPLSFRSITLPQSLPTAPNPDFSERDVEHHLSLIYQPWSSRLDIKRGAEPDDAGYYLPEEFLTKQRAAIESIARKAFALVSERTAELPLQTLKRAYQRILHLGISRLHEEVSNAALARRIQRPVLNVLRSTACASSIDRGGVMNAAYLYANAPHNASDLALGTYFGRALLSQRRLPTDFSYNALTGLLATVDRNRLHAFLSDIKAV